MSFNWRETHHGYYGLVLIALSFLYGSAGEDGPNDDRTRN